MDSFMFMDTSTYLIYFWTIFIWKWDQFQGGLTTVFNTQQGCECNKPRVEHNSKWRNRRSPPTLEHPITANFTVHSNRDPAPSLEPTNDSTASSGSDSCLSSNSVSDHGRRRTQASKTKRAKKTNESGSKKPPKLRRKKKEKVRKTQRMRTFKWTEAWQTCWPPAALNQARPVCPATRVEPTPKKMPLSSSSMNCA